MKKTLCLLAATVVATFASDASLKITTDVANKYGAMVFGGKKEIQFKRIEVTKGFELKDGWWIHPSYIVASIKKNQNAAFVDVAEPIIFYSNGRYVVKDEILDVNLQRAMPEFSKSHIEGAYVADKLLAGSANAKHKFLIFSDPLCPFCKDVVPDIVNAASAHPDEYAVYLYHFPLEAIHPEAAAICKAMITSEKTNKKKEVFAAAYDKDVKTYSEFVSKLGYEPIKPKEVDAILEKDKQTAFVEFVVMGTPTIYFDGERVADLAKIEKIIKK